MTTSLNELVCAAIARSWKGETLDALKHFVSVPAKSPAFDANWQEHGYLKQVANDAAEFGRKHFPDALFEVLEEPGRTPCLFFDIPATKTESHQNILFYGHLDKQPETQGWSNGREPFKPVIEGHRLYGRGCADDGYSVYTAFTALAALDESGTGRPRALGIIETCEETGDVDLSYWLQKLAPRCGQVGLVLVLDSEAGDYNRLWVTTSFRGNVVVTANVEVLNHGVHSGSASGIVPETFMIMRELLNRFEDSATGEILDPAFHAEIPTSRLLQLRKTADILRDEYKTNFPWVKGVCARFDSTEENMIAQCWKPQLAVIGVDGLPNVADAGNVMRASTALRLSIRIPPHVNPERALASLKKTLSENVPYNARVSFDKASIGRGWDAAPEQAWFAHSIDEASMALFGKPAAYIADGASIPILSVFEETFTGAQFFVTGVLGPNSNAHGPNEMLDLDYVEKLTCAVAHLVTKMP